MNSKISLLAGVLVAQLVIVALFSLGLGSGQPEAAAFVEVEAGGVAGISISDGEAHVTLAKHDEGWVVGDVAADDTKVSNILDKITGLEAAWPVATSSSSADRFEVTQDNFQRRVQLLDESESALAEFFLGTSPGYQRVHARAADSGDVYSIELSNFELGVKTDDWMDKSLLATSEAPSRIHVVVTGTDPSGAAEGEGGEEGGEEDADADALMPLNATLEQGDEGWLIDGGAADQDAAQTYANRFNTLRVLGIAEAADAIENIATLSITDADGEFELTVSRKDADSSDYIVQSSRIDGAYRMATYIAEQLMMSDADFMPKPDEVAVDSGEDVAEESTGES